MDYRGRHHINIHVKKYVLVMFVNKLCTIPHHYPSRATRRILKRFCSGSSPAADNDAVTAAIILTFLSVPTSVFHAWPTNETRSRGNWVAKSAGMKREKNG